MGKIKYSQNVKCLVRKIERYLIKSDRMYNGTVTIQEELTSYLLPFSPKHNKHAKKTFNASFQTIPVDYCN